MDRSEALANLKSSDSHIRLKAARYLIHHAVPEDERAIRSALATENVTWIYRALSDALKSLGQATEHVKITPDSEEEDYLLDQVNAIAVEHTSRILLHEFEPILGALRLSVGSEINEFRQSQTWHELNRLEALLRAIGRLCKSASSPQLKEFDLSIEIEEIASQESISTDVRIELAGRQHLVVVGDPDLVDIVIRNGLRNAIEATESNNIKNNGSVVITWGDTDVEYWIAIIDKGIGLPIGGQRVWEIGTSTKRGHIGMGLPIALQASRSLGGTLSLVTGAETGARFEFRWPAPKRIIE